MLEDQNNKASCRKALMQSCPKQKNRRFGCQGDGLRGSRTCVCAKTLSPGVAHAGAGCELTSCRGTVQSAWQKPPGSRQGGRAGLPARLSGRHVVRGDSPHLHPCPSQPCFGSSKGCARVTGKAGENGQYSGAGLQVTQDKTVGSRVW